jgi:hypothetical protein
MKRGIQRALLNVDDLFRYLTKTLGDAPTVERRQRERAQDEQVERSLRQIDASGWHLDVPLLLRQE